MTTREKLWIGRWVRFYQGGKLVIGEVRYAKEDKFSYRIELRTDVGAVDDDSVLEWREQREDRK